MTMNNMVDYLEKRGFKTTKKYKQKSKVYDFTITKNGITIGDSFEYPEGVSDPDKDLRQRRFLNNLIGRFYELNGENLTCDEFEFKIAEIKDVIFNDPATIVLWSDNTKTVVKCQDGDEYDAEKGLAMAIAKKFFGNKGNYCNQIKKWTDPYYEKNFMKIQAETLFPTFTIPDLSQSCTYIRDTLIKAFKKELTSDINDREEFFKDE